MKFYKKALATVLAVTLINTVSYASKKADYSDHRAVLSYAEYIVHPDSDEAGGIVVYQKNVGNAHMTSDYVYNDPRRALFNGGVPDVTYAVDDTSMTADENVTSQAYWMRESVDMWSRLTCSSAQLMETPHNGNKGVVERYFNGEGINADWGADLTQVGFRSAAEFPYFAGSPYVLGVTFTLTWVDGQGNPTDIDNNGKSDVAFREIYYNDQYSWSDVDDVPAGHVDFPTVAIHEVGHGVSSGHFGMIAVKNGSLFAKPRTIMNAIYGGKLRDLTGRDNGAFCSNWAEWPNN